MRPDIVHYLQQITMKRLLFLSLFFLSTIVGFAQQQQIVTHYTIEVAAGEQYVWTPTQLPAIDNVSSSDVSVATVNLKKPRTITIQGKKTGEATITAKQGDQTVVVKVKIVPVVTPWKGPYVYNPPKTEFHIEYVDFNSGELCKTGNINHTQVDICGELYNVTQKGVGYHSELQYLPEVNGSHDDCYTGEPERAPLGYGSHEIELFKHMKEEYAERFQKKLADLYVGMEQVCGVNCWVFDSKGAQGLYWKMWIDPANGCCLKLVDKENGHGHEVKVYDLHYHSWTKDLMPVPMSSWQIYWGD